MESAALRSAAFALPLALLLRITKSSRSSSSSQPSESPALLVSFDLIKKSACMALMRMAPLSGGPRSLALPPRARYRDSRSSRTISSSIAPAESDARRCFSLRANSRFSSSTRRWPLSAVLQSSRATSRFLYRDLKSSRTKSSSGGGFSSRACLRSISSRFKSSTRRIPSLFAPESSFNSFIDRYCTSYRCS